MTPTILYVEDDAKSRRVMRMLLVNNMKLPNVTIFEDSSDFLHRVHLLDPKPDVIFLDIHVQPFSGLEMLQMLRGSDEFSDTIIVALTASVMNEEIMQLKNAGFDGCLAKPIEIETFPQLLARLMQGEKIWYIAH
jgi:CheY-like chemotaxis protein